MQRKSWSDLTPGQRQGVVAAVSLQILLLAAAQWDITQRPAEQINGGKRLWRALAFINYFGPLAYFLVGIKRQVR